MHKRFYLTVFPSIVSLSQKELKTHPGVKSHPLELNILYINPFKAKSKHQD